MAVPKRKQHKNGCLVFSLKAQKIQNLTYRSEGGSYKRYLTGLGRDSQGNF